MESSPAAGRQRGFRLDGALLREERQLQFRPDPKSSNKTRFTQEEMADRIGVGLATYKKAESGKCVDRSVIDRIISKLGVEEVQLNVRPCDAPPPPNTRTYLDLLHKENGYIDVRGLIVGSGKAPRLPIHDVYIPLFAASAPRGKAGPPEAGPEPPMSLEKTLEHRKVVIVGDPGGGKSTFLKKLAWQESGPDGTRFPILIRIFILEDYIHRRIHSSAPDTPDADSADWIPRFLADRSRESVWGLDVDFFRAKLRERSTLIMLDGLDEVPNPPRREAIARMFERATSAYRNARFVVTTRPASYEGKSTLEEFAQFTIGDLGREAAEDFLSRWAGFLLGDDKEGARKHKEDLMAALSARPEIRRMARNPLMLTALAVIHWNERKLPEQRADLYESILKWLAEARNYEGRLPGPTILSIYGTLALEMMRYPGGRVKQIETGEAARLISDEFREEPADRRFAKAREFLENEFVDSGIVVSRADKLEFWHLTFQEYLAARACADFPDPAAVLLQEERWQKQEWREVVLLLPGVLIRIGRKQVDRFLNAILAQTKDPSCPLATRARAAGLIGSALRDLRASKYALPGDAENCYKALLHETLGIFDKDRAAGIDLKVRVEATEALGQAGDPRLNENNWIPIPGGAFFMGAQKRHKSKPGYDPDADDDEGPVRQVRVAPFEIGRYPVTVQEFAAFVEEDDETGYHKVVGPEKPDEWDEQLLHLNRPVVYVTWFAAEAYCKWRTAKNGRAYRLPSEAEWEFAARGMEGRKYPWGSEPPGTNRANYDDAYIGAATPVGLFPNGATPEGIDDLAGNVWEWTADWYDAAREGARVVRGGGWSSYSRGLRAANRVYYVPGVSGNVIGFRVVREA